MNYNFVWPSVKVTDHLFKKQPYKCFFILSDFPNAFANYPLAELE